MGRSLPRSSAVQRVATIDSLTSLRFIAAFLVFTWHVPIPSANGLHNLQLGYLGVTFFYVLSGFILTYVYYQNITQKKSGSIKKFYISRIAKLYPVHLLTFVAAIPLALSTAQVLFVDHTKIKLFITSIFNLTLTQAWVPSNKVNFSFNGVAWSISVEAFFYLVFPFIILLLYKYKRFISSKNILLAMTGLWLLCLALYLPHTSTLDDWKFYIFPIVRLPDFLIGIFLAFIYMHSSKTRPFGLKVGIKSGTVVELISVILVVVGIFSGTLMPQSVRFSIWMLPPLAFLVLVFSYQKGQLSKVLSNKVLVFLGEASFSFYMVHGLVIWYVTRLNISYWGVVILSFAIAVTLSGFLYVTYEDPLRLKLKAFLEAKFMKPVKRVRLAPIRQRLLGYLSR